jgi:glucose/arabinose dehydrogenase
VESFLGKILRIDIDSAPPNGRQYAIPADNPFVDSAKVLPEIWALGVRNPWRCSFDAANPSYFYCGDVGQGEVEEVSLIVKGGNYGWKKYEGDTTYSATTPLAAEQNEHIPPIAIYTHTEIKGKLDTRLHFVGWLVGWDSIQNSQFYIRW